MKKRILSFVLVLVFALCAIPVSVSSAEAVSGNDISEWSAKVGTISALDGGLFQINAFDESQDKSATNVKAARQAMWSGSLTAGSFTVTFDKASIFAGRGDGKSGANDTAIIFGGSGIKSSNKTTVNDIEKEASYYALMFSDDNLRIALVDKAWKGNSENFPEAASINKTVNLKNELGASWDTIKNSGKIRLTVEYTEAGAVKVYVNGNHVQGLDRAEGVCVPFGGEIGVRCGMGYHVPTKIYSVEVKNKATQTPETPETVDGWSAKLGSISALDDGLFQINAFDETKPESVSNVKGQRQAMWNGSLAEGKISITFDLASITAGRGDKNPDGTQKSGANDTAIIFGGSGIADAQGNTINKIENSSCYYAVMFSDENLRIARIQNGWQGSTDKFPAAISGIRLGEQLGDAWTEAKADGKVKLTVEFTAEGAVKVYVDDLHVAVMDRAEGSCVPFGGEVGIRCGNGFHVPTKIYDVTIEEAIDDPVDTPDDPTGTPDDPTDTPDDPTDTPDDPTGTPDDPTDTPDDPADTPKDETPKDDENKDGGSMTWIIIAAVAAVVIIVAVIGVLVAKKKKA